MVQLELPPRGRGGRRPGAGRPKGRRPNVPHLRRASFPGRFPLHVTMKVRPEVGDLRTEKRFLRMKRAFFFACDRFGVRLLHFSVQGNHLHLIVEAPDRDALTQAMQGLAIRLARGVNRASSRKGRVFADRYHSRILKTPAEVRNAVHYVLHNRQKHQRQRGGWTHPWYLDEFSSASGEACWYVHERLGAAWIVVEPRSWLARTATSPPPDAPTPSKPPPDAPTPSKAPPPAAGRAAAGRPSSLSSG